MRVFRKGVLVGAIALLAAVAVAVPASAATTTAWASWQPLAGASGAYTTAVAIAAQPAMSATVASDSRSGQVGVISGASVWLAQGTPVGAKYGSSLNKPYLNLRPKADNATSPSTTTYSFATPTPRSGWTFVLGDVDADSVRIRAVAPDGHVLDASELGFQGGFNYCAPGIVGKPSCTGAADDVPTWDAASLTLTGNAAAADTSGAAAWFEPTTPIASLSFVFTRRAGFPVYQTWFASISRDITGTVTDIVDGALAGVTLTLTDGNGTVIGTTTTAADGTYSFPGYVASDGYTVRVTPPAGKITTTTPSVPANLTDSDAVADFTVREVVPVAVSGRITDDDGNPISDVVVNVDGQTTTTDADGQYLFDQVSVGTHTATITTPDGYTVSSSPPPFTVPPGSEDPIENLDFVVAENPSLSGTVRANGTGIAGVTVTATGPDGPRTTVTDANGFYLFPRLPLGGYDVTMTTPDGYVATSAVSRDEEVADTDVENADFDLARLGAFDGTVRTDAGDPVGSVVITVAGPDGSQQLTSDPDGTFGLGALPPGTYTLTVVPPSGTTVVGEAARTVAITAAGEAVGEQDFTLAAIAIPPAPDPDPEPVNGGSTGGSGSSPLPATGLGPESFAWAGGGTAAVVLGILLFIVARRRGLLS